MCKIVSNDKNILVAVQGQCECNYPKYSVTYLFVNITAGRRSVQETPLEIIYYFCKPVGAVSSAKLHAVALSA